MACILKKKYKDTIHSILRRYLISIFTGALTMLIDRLSKAKVNRAFSWDILDMAALVEGYQQQIIRIREMLDQEFSGTGVKIQEQYVLLSCLARQCGAYRPDLMFSAEHGFWPYIRWKNAADQRKSQQNV